MKKIFVGIIPLVLCLFGLVVAPVLAQEPVVDNETLETLGRTLMSFVFAAIIWALTGFFKVKDPAEDVFNPVQFFTTLVVGAITGVFAFVIYELTGTSLQPTQIWQYLVAAGFVAFIESWFKVVWRRLGPYFTPPKK